MRYVQALCQAQNNGTILGVKGVAGKKHKENFRGTEDSFTDVHKNWWRF